MSKRDLLNEDETARARAQGWVLVEVFDLASRRLAPQILPIEFKAPISTAKAARAWVISQARTGDQLAGKALHAVMQGLKNGPISS